MAWLQSLSEGLGHLFASGPAEDAAAEPDIQYLEKVNRRDLNPDLAARQREYVGVGTQQRDAEELRKLRNKWDSDEWRRPPEINAPMAPAHAVKHDPTFYDPTRFHVSSLPYHDDPYFKTSPAPSMQAAMAEKLKQWDPMKPHQPPTKNVQPAYHPTDYPYRLQAGQARVQQDTYTTAKVVPRGPTGVAMGDDLRDHLAHMQDKADSVLGSQIFQRTEKRLLSSTQSVTGVNNAVGKPEPVDAAGPSISSGVLAAIQLSALPNDPDTTLPAPAEGTFSHALLNPVAVAMRDVDKPEYQPTTIARAYGGTEHMKPGPDGFAVETNPRAPQDNIQGWSREKLIKVATSFDIKYNEMSDEELYAVVREHIMRDLGLYPDNPLDLAGNASSGTPEEPHDQATASNQPAPPPGAVVPVQAPDGTIAPLFASQPQAGPNSTLSHHHDLQERLPTEPYSDQTVEQAYLSQQQGLVRVDDDINSSGMKSLAEILWAVKGDQRIGAATSIRILCMQDPRHKDWAAKLGVMQPLVEMMNTGTFAAIAAAAGALQKIVSHHHDNQMLAVKGRAVEALVKAAWGEPGRVSAEGRKLAIRTLRNISNAPQALEAMATAGTVAPMVKMIEQASKGLQGLNAEERMAAVAALQCLRNMVAAEGNWSGLSTVGAILTHSRPTKAMFDAGAVPMVCATLRVLRSDEGWGAACGLLCNMCTVWPDCQNVCQMQNMPAYLAEAYMGGSEFTRAAAAAALWAVQGLHPPPSMNQYRMDAPPMCHSEGVKAYYNGNLLEDHWWEPPILPLVRMLRENTDLAREAAAAALASIAVTRTQDNEAKECGLEVAMYTSEESGQGPCLDDMCKRRQLTHNFSLEVETEILPHPEIQEAMARNTCVAAAIEVLERGGAATTQPAAAALIDALVAGAPNNAAQVVERGGVTPLVRMLSSGSPHGKASAAAALCALSEEREVAMCVLRAGALSQLVLLLTCGDNAGRLQAARTLLRLAMHDSSAVQASGSVPALVQEVAGQMTGGVPKGPHAARLLLRKELAICALLLMCRRSPEQQLFVARAGCVKPLAVLIEDSPPRCRRAAIALTDVIAQNEGARETVAESTVNPLVKVGCERNNEAMAEARITAATCLWRLALDNPVRALQIYRAGAMPMINQLLCTNKPRARSAAVLLLGEISFCVDIKLMEEMSHMVLNMLQEKVGSGAAEACLTIQRVVSRGMRASDPRVVVHRNGSCPRNQNCDVCYTQGLFGNAIPALLRHISGFDFGVNQPNQLQTALPPDIQELVYAAQEAAVGALSVLMEQNYVNTSKAVTGGALLEVAELMKHGGTTGGRIEAATCLSMMCIAGGAPVRLKAPTVGLLVPALELCEAGMTVNDIFMSLNSDSHMEKSRIEIWKNAPGEVLVEAFMAGTRLLASLSEEKENSLSISVCRPKALDPIVRLAARGYLKGMQVLDAPRAHVVFSSNTPGVQEYTENACKCLMNMCRQPKLHFLLHQAGAFNTMLQRIQDRQFTTTVAIHYCLRGLLALLNTSEAAKLTREPVPATKVYDRMPDEMQTILLGEGALEAVADVLRSAPEEEIKATAALVFASLAEVSTTTERERVVLSMKIPLMILKNEVASCEESRTAADTALAALTGVESRTATSWAMNQHGQTVATGHYGANPVRDMDLID